MPIEKCQRRNNVPFIYVKGTHYEVGYDVGRAFRYMIQSYLDIHGPLNEIYIPLYESKDGRNAYELTLAEVKKNFPQYVDEIRGTAAGANVPFHKLFLLHMDEIISKKPEEANENMTGCSTVCCNKAGQEILGHNEDALEETLNHFYFVSAEIVETEPKGRWRVKEEKFTSLCYAGTLPGFTMSYNKYGLISCVNVIRVKNMQAGKTPRSILARALLAARDILQVKNILTDSGTGIGDGISFNLTFLKDERNKFFYNVEVGPSDFTQKYSLVDILTVNPDENFYHCNRFLRLECEEADSPLIISSKHREETMNSHPAPINFTGVSNILGDESDQNYPVFRDKGKTKTILTGIFNMRKSTLSVFTDNPKTKNPVFEMPIII